MAEPYLHLKGFSSIGESLLTDQLTTNIIAFYQYALLNKGSYFSVTIPTSGSYGGSFHQLRPTHDPNYTDGRIWQGVRRDWVYEQGLDYHTQPIRVSGVRVSGVFYHKDVTGSYAHTIDYINGRIVFASAISVNSTVTCEYSYRYFHFTTHEAAWFRELQTNSFRPDDRHFTQLASGNWAILAQNRVQLPAVVIEPVPRRSFKGYQLGGGQFVYNDVLFHIFAETPWERDTLVDVITYQNEKTIHSFNKNTVAASGKFPLNNDGSISSGIIDYPDLVNINSPYFWKKLTFLNTVAVDVGYIPQLYQGLVRTTVEAILPEI